MIAVCWSVLSVAWIILVLSMRDRYRDRVLNIGVNLIMEARTVKAEYPQEYPTYHAEAVEALTSRGVGALVTLLPSEKD